VNGLENKNFVTDMASDALSIPMYIGRFKIFSKFCCSLSKKGSNMKNNMNNIGNGFFKSLKIEKTITYTYSNVSQN